LPEIELMGSERPDREMTEASDVTSLINDTVRSGPGWCYASWLLD
jgi:hypothetical protein